MTEKNCLITKGLATITLAASITTVGLAHDSPSSRQTNSD